MQVTVTACRGPLFLSSRARRCPLTKTPCAAVVDSLVATVKPVAKIALICSIGAILARQGSLNENGRLTVSRLNFLVFTPCIFLSKFSSFSIGQMINSVPTHLMMIASHLMGALLGLIFVKSSRDRSMQNHVLALTTVGNVGNLPMVLVESLKDASSLLSSQIGLSHVLMANISAAFIQFPLVNLLLSPATASASFGSLAQSLFTPSVIAAILGLIIAQSSTVKEAIFGSIVGEAINMLSDCCIPTLLLVLGANLSRGPGIVSIPWSTLASIATIRLILLPLAGMSLVIASCRLGLLKTSDPNLLIVLMMMNAMPSALLVHNIATLNLNRADEVAVMLFWQYLFCIITLPILMSVFVSTSLHLTLI